MRIADSHRVSLLRAGLLQGVVPTLAFKVFLVIVPSILRWTAMHVSAFPSKSDVDFEVGRKYYIFQFVTVFLFTTVVGAMLAQAPPTERARTNPFPLIDLVEILGANPGKVRIWLARSIPQQVRLDLPSLAFERGQAG